ncbi:MAG: prolyl oligopeptidase family serine peptidase [Chitinophaga sp.]|uniref:alpha/beta hydrolase family protein n=1 Tax=Chitinophaga sp. TaxID=1869181 RepID=UPI0025C43F36|nr:prolyl oligopeptidase family serine peptidase [Chitinophaga sp.]MBV8253622.1 prolyl oligopeptidase family serine peptidase [Chitinophaga sp.]
MRSNFCSKSPNRKRLYYIIRYIAILCTLSIQVYSQHKPPLNDESYQNWPSAMYTSNAISDDGEYVWYTEYNVPIGQNTLIIQATKGDWKFESQKYKTAILIKTKNESYAILSDGDTLQLLKLGTSTGRIFLGKAPIVGYTSFNQKDIAKWLIYKDNNNQSMKFHNLDNENETAYNKMTECKTLDIPNTFLVTLTIGDSKKIGILNLANKKIDTIVTIPTKSSIITEYLHSEINKKYYIRVSYKQNGNKNQTNVSIYSYDIKSRNSKVILNNDILGAIDSTSIISSYFWGLTSDDNILYFFADRYTAVRNSNKAGSSGIIWKYTDRHLKPNTGEGQLLTKALLSTLNLKTNKIRIIGSENSMLAVNQMTGKHGISSGKAIMYSFPKLTYLDNMYRYKDSITSISVSLYDGTKDTIDFPFGGFQSLSPNGSYLISANRDRTKFSFHNLKENEKLNINIPFNIDNNDPDIPFKYLPNMAGWSPSGDTAFIYTKYDIWMVTKETTDNPVNLTNGFGEKSQIKFRFQNENQIINLSSDSILYALNQSSKNNGFYVLSNKRNQDPKELSMGPFYYHFPSVTDELSLLITSTGNYLPPIKAKYAEAYILGRSTASKTRNIVFTADLKTFSEISKLAPEYKFNWLTSELVNWEVKPGIYRQGILYKPEDFDSTRKYPVLFYVYDQFSNALNASLVPSNLNNGCAINIPYYVSNGFLVFCPDAYIQKGDPLQGVAKNINQSIMALSKKIYIDTSRLGIQGCSQGAVEVNFIITQIKKFAAACSASGMANPVSILNYHDANTYDPYYNYFTTGMRFEKELYEDKDIYIRNSAILYGNQVQTPLLLMHTDKDGRMPIFDIIQFFTALKNEKKPVWLLEYTDGSHGVWGESGLDFSKKMNQFFNYYLKNQEPPDWMMP